MANHSYLCFGGVELNSSQAAAYGRTGWAPDSACIKDCCLCEGLDKALGFENGYTTPANDAAPWYDPSEPDSYDFGGMIIQKVEGLGPGQYERKVTELAGEGAVIGRGRHNAPTITVTGVLMGRTGCAIAYGLRWLRQVLKGNCSPQVRCTGEDLRYLECCPPELDEDCPDVDLDAWADHFAPYWRALKRVSLVSGVQVIERIGKACSCGCGNTPLIRVQFILAAGQPCAFREPVQVSESVPLAEGEYFDECFTWVKLPDDGSEECPPDEETCVEPEPCTFDPAGCPTPPAPPPVPVPVNSCLTCTPFTRRRVCIDIPPDVIPAAAEGVVGMTIYSGTTALRHVRVRFYQNPLGFPVDELNPCVACSELNIAYIPPNSEFKLDGAERSTTITCPGSAPTSAASVLGGPPGRLFSYPVLECGGVRFTACIEADGETVNDASTVSLSMSVREC